MSRTKLDKMMDRECDLARGREHAQALIAGLAPDPRAWEYRGEMLHDASGKAQCVCGHAIAYLFPVYRGHDMRVLGSTCITHYATINPEAAAAMTAKLNEVMRERQEVEKIAREAARMEEVETLYAEHERILGELTEMYLSYYNRGERAPFWLWQVVKSNRYSVPGPHRRPAYSRACDMIRWHKKQIARLKEAAEGGAHPK